MRLCKKAALCSYVHVLLVAAKVCASVRLGSQKEQCNEFISCASCTTAHFRIDDGTAENSLNTIGGSMIERQLSGIPHRRPTCVWSHSLGECQNKSKHKNDNNATNPYQFECPLGPTRYPDVPPTILPHWMELMVNATAGVRNFSLTDLSLPGTHDSFTYDLSLQVSDDGLDGMQELANFLHFISGGTIHLLPGDLEEFSRLQAKTQQLTITQQLDNGIRFIDFRLMYQQDMNAWYSIHFMQSKLTVELYWTEIRQWLDEHPHEIIVLWLSRHGNPAATGDDQYPGVTPAQKKELWDMYQSIFDGLLFDTSISDIHTTPFHILLERNHRVVTFATDYTEFTGRSVWALDAAARIQNTYESGDGIFAGPDTYLAHHERYFHNARANNAKARAAGGFTLLALNTQGTPWLIQDAAIERFLPWIPHNNINHNTTTTTTTILLSTKCADKIEIDSIDTWCPRTLLDVVQLGSYYNQVSLERAFQTSAFPMAFYLDGLDYDGTIRTGSQLLDGYTPPNLDEVHKSDGYAFVDTVIAYNLKQVCDKRTTNTCQEYMNMVNHRRAKHPVITWSEGKHGRSKIKP